MKWIIIALFAIAAWIPAVVMAQGDYGVRIPSRDGQCLAPVASRLIGSNERDHTGRKSPTLAWDWSAAIGSPVFSICPGTVREASSSNRGGYGWFVVIDHGAGMSTLYAHCMQNSFRVKAGDRVDTWTQICSVGMTGMTSWPHVHLNIDNGGAHQPISNYFDPALTHYCHFTRCQATNEPGDPIRTDGVVASAGQAAAAAAAAVQMPPAAALTGLTFRSMIARDLLGELTKRQIAQLFYLLPVFVLFGLLALPAGAARTAGVSVASTVITTVMFLWMVNPTVSGQAQQAPVTAPAQGSTQGAWEAAYKFMRRWEGAKCVHDPVRTYKGITNSTYNAWRMRNNLGPGDVCRDLTEAQAEAIYYMNYWVASGANRLPPALAISHFDHAVNAGVGAANRLLAQCGNNVNCYIPARYADYRTKKNCPQYCRAWFNRVDDSIRYISGLAAVARAIN